MSNLLSSLLSSSGALSAYDQVLSVTQNNVANASTPGFVKQRQLLRAMPFDPALGSGGGVFRRRAGGQRLTGRGAQGTERDILIPEFRPSAGPG